MIRAVLFDLFETLVTESNASIRRASSLAPELGLNEDSYRGHWRSRRRDLVLGRSSFRDVLAEIIRTLGGAPDDRVLDGLRGERMRDKAAVLRAVEPDVLAAIHALRAGGVKLTPPSPAYRMALDFFAHDAPHHRLKRFAALLHESAQCLVDERLIVASTSSMDLRTEPRQNIVVEANRDPGLAGRNRENRSALRLAEVIFLTSFSRLRPRGAPRPAARGLPNLTMAPQPTLRTDRLLLRPFRVEDAAVVRRLAGAREIADTTLTIPHPYLDGMAEGWIGTHADEWDRQERATFAITSEGDGVIGAISVHLKLAHRRAELGYWVGRPFWNRGFATEAARAVIAFGFETLGLNRIHASHLTRNPASGRVMVKAGMRFEGTLRQHVVKWDCAEDLAEYAILRSDYQPSAHRGSIGGQP